jgi:hypothetical protein
VALKGPCTTPVGEGFTFNQREATQGLQLCMRRCGPCAACPVLKLDTKT